MELMTRDTRSSKSVTVTRTLLKLSMIFFTCRSGKCTKASRVTIRSKGLYGCCETMSITMNFRLVLPNLSRSNLISPRTISPPIYSTSIYNRVLVSLSGSTPRHEWIDTYRVDWLDVPCSNSTLRIQFKSPHGTSSNDRTLYFDATVCTMLRTSTVCFNSEPARLQINIIYSCGNIDRNLYITYLDQRRILLIARTIFQKWYQIPPSALDQLCSPILLRHVNKHGIYFI